MTREDEIRANRSLCRDPVMEDEIGDLLSLLDAERAAHAKTRDDRDRYMRAADQSASEVANLRADRDTWKARAEKAEAGLFRIKMAACSVLVWAHDGTADVETTLRAIGVLSEKVKKAEAERDALQEIVAQWKRGNEAKVGGGR